jgi:thiosulfate/3-mercaptopyruvate sulfurtransferase
VASFTTLIDPEQLAAELVQHTAPELVLVDCRASLLEPEAGALSYAKSHLPGAVFADLLEDLSGPVVPGKTGRHPLPEPELFADRLRDWGVCSATQVVAYDDSGGAFAARLWWMLRWLGHSKAAVLNGGWSAWMASGLPITAGQLPRARGDFEPQLRPELLVQAAEVRQAMQQGQVLLLDARAPERYRGDVEPMDVVAGHIPGALNLPFAENLHEGRFRSAPDLRARIVARLGRTPEQAVAYCGSGVTACHDVLAFVYAGLPEPRLYAGSWSEWITDPERPVATSGR